MSNKDYPSDFDLLEVVADRPDHAPDGWLIFNAPRPICGSLVNRQPLIWQGKFVDGIFYAAVNPDDSMAETWIEENRKNKATILIHVPLDYHRERALAWFEQYASESDYGSEFDELEFADIEMMYWAKNPARRRC